MHDHQGNTRVVLDDADAVKSWYDYYPYGLIQRASIAGSDARFKFTGKEFDSEDDFDLYYFGARYYDPEIAGWLVTDPVSQYHSQYSYVGGNPLNYVDPNGQFGLPGWLGKGLNRLGGAVNDLFAGRFQSNTPISFGGHPYGPTDIGGIGLPSSGTPGAWADRIILDSKGKIKKILKFKWWNPYTWRYYGDQFAFEGYERFVFNAPTVERTKWVDPYLARDAMQSIGFYVMTDQQALTVASMLTFQAPLHSFGYSMLSIAMSAGEGDTEGVIVGSGTLATGVALSAMMGPRGALISGAAQLAYDFGAFDSNGQNSTASHDAGLDFFTSADNTRTNVVPNANSF